MRELTYTLLFFINCFVAMSAYAEEEKANSALTESETKIFVQQEITRLRTEEPSWFHGWQVDKQLEEFIENSGPSTQGHILLCAAAEHVQYDLEKFQQAFPGLHSVYDITFLGDFDQDNAPEIFSVFHLTGKHVYLSVLRCGEHGNIALYNHEVISEYGHWLDISVRKLPDGEVHIIGQVTTQGLVPVKGDLNREVQLEKLYEMELRFTGTAFEVVEPLRLMKQWLLMEN
ncbi:hypothetical protein CSA56_05120 [candidate division KSB3 bacterium]|uniref:Uncharacterized protein n=1 Tax=candidate division KSB3 bacterium TaxID=2044937 RepID=A0A2G6KK63_9BACT|nr:MAG: hypothetical protein CSA56_05120 [candidate division KSB3 bacterium]